MFSRKWSYSDTKLYRMSDKLFFIKRTSLSDKGNSDIHRFNILYIVYIFVLFQGRSKQVSQMMIFNDPFGNEIRITLLYTFDFLTWPTENSENFRRMMTKNIIKSSHESFMTKFLSLENILKKKTCKFVCKKIMIIYIKRLLEIFLEFSCRT